MIGDFSTGSDKPYLCPSCKQPLVLFDKWDWIVNHLEWNGRAYEEVDQEGDHGVTKAYCDNEQCDRYLYKSGTDPEERYIFPDEVE